MKRALAVLVALVLVTAWVGVAAAEEGEAGLAVAGNAEVAGSVRAPDCGAAMSRDGVEAGIEALLEPQPTPKAINCGTCSDSQCVGQANGALCGFSGGRFKYCTPLLGNLCPGEFAWDCTCTSSGPY